MHWVEKPGTSLDAMRRITERASRELMAVPGVRNFGAHIGRAEVADEVVGPNFTELWISLDPSVDYEATVARIQSIVDGYPGLYRDLLTYLRERIKEVLTGASATIVVRVYGPELDGFAAQAQAVRAAIANVSGVADLTVQAQVVVPKVEVRFDPERAAAFGLTPGQVRSRGGHARAGHQGRRVLRRPAALRRRRLGCARGAPQPGRRSRAAGAGRQRRARAARQRGARRGDADAERDHERERVAPDRRHVERARPRSRRGRP